MHKLPSVERRSGVQVGRLQESIHQEQGDAQLRALAGDLCMAETALCYRKGGLPKLPRHLECLSG